MSINGTSISHPTHAGLSVDGAVAACMSTSWESPGKIAIVAAANQDGETGVFIACARSSRSSWGKTEDARDETGSVVSGSASVPFFAVLRLAPPPWPSVWLVVRFLFIEDGLC